MEKVAVEEQKVKNFPRKKAAASGCRYRCLIRSPYSIAQLRRHRFQENEFLTSVYSTAALHPQYDTHVYLTHIYVISKHEFLYTY